MYVCVVGLIVLHLLTINTTTVVVVVERDEAGIYMHTYPRFL